MQTFVQKQSSNKMADASSPKKEILNELAINMDGHIQPVMSPHFNVDFGKINIFPSINPQIQRDMANSKEAKNRREQEDYTKLLSSAASESSIPLEPLVQNKLKQHLNYDFSKVQIHQGSDSIRAAEYLGAKAYTLGNAIHLGKEFSNLNQADRLKLLSHEAIHTVQQGGISVKPHSKLTVSTPEDAAETEAVQVANLISLQDVPSTSSQSLNLRNRMRNERSNHTIANKVSPHVQRDLKGKHTVTDGTFDINLKTESHPGAKNGMSGTIKFKASDKAPDSKNIRLLQIARDEDLTTGKEYVWTGGEANRNKVMTTDDKTKGITGGFFVDLLHANRTPRTSKADAPVSPYYIDDYGTGGGNQDGSKAGKTINEASLWDFPGSSGNRRFSLETAAKGADTGYIYATLTWGFTISDAAKGKVDHEYAAPHLIQSATFDAAVKNFNEFYKNPGSSTAP